MTSGRTPVAIGSSVPRCPTERSPQMRRTLATTSCEVIPAGLSTIRMPSIAMSAYGRAGSAAGQS